MHTPAVEASGAQRAGSVAQVMVTRDDGVIIDNLQRLHADLQCHDQENGRVRDAMGYVDEMLDAARDSSYGNSSNYFAVIALHEGKPVGAADFDIRREEPFGRICELFRMATNPSTQGYGQQMLEQVVTAAAFGIRDALFRLDGAARGQVLGLLGDRLPKDSPVHTAVVRGLQDGSMPDVLAEVLLPGMLEGDPQALQAFNGALRDAMARQPG